MHDAKEKILSFPASHQTRMGAERVAVVMPNPLGDIAMATPALRALRRGRPDAEITLVVRRPMAPLLEEGQFHDHLLAHDIYAEPSAWRRLVARRRIGRQLRGFDSVIVLPNSWSGALLAWLSGARERIGYARRRRDVLLTQAVPAPREQGRFTPVAMERYYLDLVRAIGCPDVGTQTELSVSRESLERCDALFLEFGIRSGAPLVCFAPGAGFGPSKVWPVEYAAQLASALINDGCQIALVHGPGEEALAEVILSGTQGRAFSLGGEALTLDLLKAVLSRADLLVCNDAGARHIATAFDVPALVLVGPTSIAYTNLNLKKTKLLREPVDCSPCHLKVCPIDHRCMTRLLPERVLAEARAALRDPAWKGDVELELNT